MVVVHWSRWKSWSHFHLWRGGENVPIFWHELYFISIMDGRQASVWTSLCHCVRVLKYEVHTRRGGSCLLTTNWAKSLTGILGWVVVWSFATSQCLLTMCVCVLVLFREETRQYYLYVALQLCVHKMILSATVPSIIPQVHSLSVWKMTTMIFFPMVSSLMRQILVHQCN